MLSNYMTDKEWFTPELSYVDFLAYELIDWLRLFSPSTFDEYPTLQSYLDRFEALPAIKEYFNSPEYKSWPIASSAAKWGYYQ